MGINSTILQQNVDCLLKKVSTDICERVREDHLTRAAALGGQIDETRKTLQSQFSQTDLYQLDSRISQDIEEMKHTMMDKHRKKLEFLQEKPDVIVIDDTDDLQQPPTTHVENNVQHPTEKTNGKKSNKKIKSKNKNINHEVEVKQKTVNKHSTAEKQKPININSTAENSKNDKVGSDEPTIKPPMSNSRHPRVVTNTANRNPKNFKTPGTTYSYAEAVQNGVQINQTLATLQMTLETLTKSVNSLMSVTKKKREIAGLYELKTGKRGEVIKRDKNKYGGGKRQF